jgi:hypothetical protein
VDAELLAEEDDELAQDDEETDELGEELEDDEEYDSACCLASPNHSLK